MPSNQTANETARAILPELQNRLAKMRKVLDEGKAPSSDSDDSTSTVESSLNCSFVIYGQIAPLPIPVSDAQRDELEKELDHPTGVSLPHVGPPKFSALMHSENCRLLLKVGEIEGLRMATFWDKSVNYAAALTLVAIIQTLLVVRQMESTNTPSVRAKLIYYNVIDYVCP